MIECGSCLTSSSARALVSLAEELDFQRQAELVALGEGHQWTECSCRNCHASPFSTHASRVVGYH